ncbi:MAG: hypothetical protein ABIM50_06775 [Novosphingobium sp.]
MSTKKTTTKSNPVNNIRVKLAEVQVQAKKAGEVAKANALVAVASSKTLAAGLKEIGTVYVADSRNAVVVLKDDFKAIKGVKSVPAFVRLQGEQTARNIEAISAVASKNVASLRELVGGKVAPMVTDRLKANLELFRKAA